MGRWRTVRAANETLAARYATIIGLVERNVGQLLTRHFQHPGVEVQPFDDVVAAQLQQVGASAAGDSDQNASADPHVGQVEVVFPG
jgi:hypothetical protein